MKPAVSSEKLSFPRTWEYRLFFDVTKVAEALPEIRKAAAGAGVTVEITTGKRSAGDKYQAVRVSGIVDSLETAEKLGKALGIVPGVKFLL